VAPGAFSEGIVDALDYEANYTTATVLVALVAAYPLSPAAGPRS
jgi:hypothetical protein